MSGINVCTAGSQYYCAREAERDVHFKTCDKRHLKNREHSHRHQPQRGSEQKPDQIGQRTLRAVSHPKVGGAALWAAHALLAACHIDASDRSSGSTAQHRHCARILQSAPAGQGWMSQRRESWPITYRARWWIDLVWIRQRRSRRTTSMLTQIVEIINANN